MEMALKRHELEQERKLYVKELHLHDHHAKVQADRDAKNEQMQNREFERARLDHTYCE